jgi:hypothetical protein
LLIITEREWLAFRLLHHNSQTGSVPVTEADMSVAGEGDSIDEQLENRNHADFHLLFERTCKKSNVDETETNWGCCLPGSSFGRAELGS